MGNVLLPLLLVNAKTYPSQQEYFSWEPYLSMVIGMVNHEAFTGRRHLSPFNFMHNNVEYLSLCQNGRQVPVKTLQRLGCKALTMGFLSESFTTCLPPQGDT